MHDSQSMMALLYFFSPLLLIVWAGSTGFSDRITFVVKTAGILSVFSFLYLAGSWYISSPYLVHIYTLLLFAALLRSSLAAGKKKWSQESGERLPLVAVSILLLGFGFHGSSESFLGRFLPVKPVGSIGLPFVEGRYIVSQGGSSHFINAHHAMSADSNTQERAWRDGVDFVAVDQWGRRSPHLFQRKLSDYYSFGGSVVAPCSGRVIEIQSDHPDFLSPSQDRGHPLGNYIAIHCKNLPEDTLLVLAHLKQDSISVSPGQKIREKNYLGKMGRSGVANEPHLHVHIQKREKSGNLLAGEPHPFLVDGVYLYKNKIVEASLD